MVPVHGRKLSVRVSVSCRFMMHTFMNASKVILVHVFAEDQINFIFFVPTITPYHNLIELSVRWKENKSRLFKVIGYTKCWRNREGSRP